MDKPFYKQTRYLLLMAAAPAIIVAWSLSSGETFGVFTMAGLSLFFLSLAARNSANERLARIAGLLLSLAFLSLVYSLVRMLDLKH